METTMNAQCYGGPRDGQLIKCSGVGIIGISSISPYAVVPKSTPGCHNYQVFETGRADYIRRIKKVNHGRKPT